MRIYAAPMEGITSYIYRREHRRAFGGIDRYYTPFITSNHGKSLTSREMNDVLPEHNEGVPVVPQILANDAEGFLQCAEKLCALGYSEVNLNLGCPSAKVANRGRGSGFLADPSALERFLEEIFAKTPIRVSVKTRVGDATDEDWPRLLTILSRFPLAELIVHPRTRSDMYKGEPRMACFDGALLVARAPVVYNGNMFTADDLVRLSQRYDALSAAMLGRGLIADPGLAQTYASGVRPAKEVYRAFLDAVLDGYLERWGDGRAVLCHMKEIWAYMVSLFGESARQSKRIRKAADVASYRQAANALFDECEWDPGRGFAFRRL